MAEKRSPRRYISRRNMSTLDEKPLGISMVRWLGPIAFVCGTLGTIGSFFIAFDPRYSPHQNWYLFQSIFCLFIGVSGFLLTLLVRRRDKTTPDRLILFFFVAAILYILLDALRDFASQQGITLASIAYSFTGSVISYLLIATYLRNSAAIKKYFGVTASASRILLWTKIENRIATQMFKKHGALSRDI